MRKIILTILFLLVTTAISLDNAHAEERYTDDFNAYYGTSGGYNYNPVMGSCLTCHPSGSNRNSYANDWRNNGRSFSAIENLDSDNDGFINIDEIDAGTFPGDSSSRPTITNDPPLANAGPNQTVDEGVTVILDGSNSSDPDDGIASYSWTQTGGLPVSLSDSSVEQPTFTAPDVSASGESMTFRLIVTDNGGQQSSDTCIVNVTWINQPPTADAGPDQAVNEGVTVTLNASNSSDPDNDIASYQWSQTGGSSVSLSSTTSNRPTFTSPNVGPSGESLTFQLTVTDSGGLQSTDTCVVNVSWVNLPPTADAGPDQPVNEGIAVTLDGSGSTDPDNGIASYQWSQTGGYPVTLSTTTGVQPAFTAPDVGTSGDSLTFQLTVTDSGGLQSTDTCVVNVSWVNSPPNADAGPDQTVNSGVSVTLDGSNSVDPDDAIASYQWSQTGGTPVTFSSSTAAQPTFTAPDVGGSSESLNFQLIVTDSGGLQSTDTCIVNVSQGNLPPTADAGPDQTADEGNAVTLDGSNSTDPDDGITSYLWTQTGGPAVSLSSRNAVQPSFTAPDVGPSGESLTFELTVTDNGGLQSTNTCIVNISWVNLAPTADAGPDQSANDGDAVTLDGSNSTDPDDGIASYLWTQTAGTPVTLSSTTVFRPTFMAPSVGSGGESLTFQLTVTDSGGLQSTDTCIVNISWVNLAPTADAGTDQTANENDTITLDGSNSTDPDDGIAAYLWTQTSGAPVTLSDSATAQPTFSAPNVGMNGASLVFQLTVTDGVGLQSTDTCIVNVTWVNEVPIATAGSNQTVSEGSTVTLDGSNSTDPDDGIASYLWTQTGGPAVTLSDPAAVQPTFVALPVDPSGSALTFSLMVEDVGGLQASDQVSVIVDDNGITGFPTNAITTTTYSGDPIGIEVNSGDAITRFTSVDLSTMPTAAGMPEDLIFGLIDMEIRVGTPGATTTVTVYLPSAAPDGHKWFKCSSPNTWIDYSADAVFSPARDQVTITLTDGGTGDDDGMVNGVIVDPSGPGVAATTPVPSPLSSPTTTADDWGSSSIGGCFISATASAPLIGSGVQVVNPSLLPSAGLEANPLFMASLLVVLVLGGTRVLGSRRERSLD